MNTMECFSSSILNPQVLGLDKTRKYKGFPFMENEMKDKAKCPFQNTLKLYSIYWVHVLVQGSEWYSFCMNRFSFQIFVKKIITVWKCCIKEKDSFGCLGTHMHLGTRRYNSPSGKLEELGKLFTFSESQFPYHIT